MVSDVAKEGTGAGRSNGTYVEHRHCETVREMYQTMHTSSLHEFTFPRVDALRSELQGIVHALDHLPEPAFKELIEVIIDLREARNELALAGFLFDLEELNSVHRLVLRNKAVLRSKRRLATVLEVWPLKAARNSNQGRL